MAGTGRSLLASVTSFAPDLDVTDPVRVASGCPGQQANPAKYVDRFDLGMTTLLCRQETA